MEVIINNTVLSNFAYVNRLDLIFSLLGIIYISSEVRQEILNGIEERYDFLKRIEDKISLEDKDGWFKQTTISSREENQSLL
ncbi:MAG: hypothetical protein AB1567_11430 [bacterium]